MHADKISPEVILGIQRVLDLENNKEVDDLDGFVKDFSPVEVLNKFFPDGA